jgi:hypothetical protein
MDVANETILVQERLVGRRSVGGICPHPARRIALVEQTLNDGPHRLEIHRRPERLKLIA